MSFRNSQPYEWGGSYILLFEIYMHVIVAIYYNNSADNVAMAAC